MSTGFEALLAEGLGVDVESRWGTGFLPGRYLPGEPPWSWADVVRPWLDSAESALDMGTGDGAVLAGLRPLPPLTVAQEEWLPTVPAAVQTLRPLDVPLVLAEGSSDNTADETGRQGLPFRDGAFDVVLNRHEAFDATEVLRVLKPGGAFCTQQVGDEEAASVRSLLELPGLPGGWDLGEATSQVSAAGLDVLDAREARVPTTFTDVAALVAYVRVLPWQVPEFDAGRLRPVLQRLHEQCCRAGGVTAVTHRFLVVAQRPRSSH